MFYILEFFLYVSAIFYGLQNAFINGKSHQNSVWAAFPNTYTYMYTCTIYIETTALQ